VHVLLTDASKSPSIQTDSGVLLQGNPPAEVVASELVVELVVACWVVVAPVVVVTTGTGVGFKDGLVDVEGNSEGSRDGLVDILGLTEG